MSIIKHVTLQKIVAHDFRYDPRTMYVSGRFRSSTGLFLQERGIKWAVERMGVRCQTYKLFCWRDSNTNFINTKRIYTIFRQLVTNLFM